MRRAETNRMDQVEAAVSGEPEPYAIAILRECGDYVPTMLIWGCQAWPIAADEGKCGACKGRIRRPHYCLVCNRPMGTLAARVEAVRLRRAAAKSAKGLKGGMGRRDLTCASQRS